MDRIYATYLIETAHPLAQAAAVLAGEQSAGTFVRVPGETDQLRQRHSASVEQITELETVTTPSLPGSQPPTGTASPVYHRAEVVISFPLDNIGHSLPQLMTTVAGNLFELAPFSGLRLLDVIVPEIFASACPGPQFGIAGTRRLAGVRERPLIGTIIKPSVGLTPDQTAALVKTLCEAGLDFIKDDELIADAPYSPVAARATAVMRVINEHAEKTGKKVMYAFNISGDVDSMRRHHDLILDAGGTCVMVNIIAVGLTGVESLRKHSQLPIHGHRNGWGVLTRSPALGFDYRAWQKFWRFAGCDQLHVNGIRNKFCEPDESVIASALACLTPTPDGKTVMPVFSSGQWAGQAPDTYQALNSLDLIYLAGGGILAHPAGPAAGVKSLREGWEAAIKGIPLEVYARDHVALQQAIEKYGTS